MRRASLRSIVAVVALATAVLTSPAARATVSPPLFTVYAAPGGLATSAGEPSIGVDLLSQKVMFQATTQTLRVSFDDSVTPTAATWTDVSPLITSKRTADPILFTDGASGHTIVSQLDLACSLMALTDDDGSSWTQQPAGCAPGAAVDHQSVGGGPYAEPRPVTATTSRAYYYCAQSLIEAQCGRSDTGGLTWGPAVPIYPVNGCNQGVHGHIKVAPDGTVYVPYDSCAPGRPGVAVSRDNGVSWSVHNVPDASAPPGANDPSVGVATDGTVYFGYANSMDRARISVSHDRGSTWTTSVDVGAALGLKHIAFPAVVAGDPDRAAFAFLGTTTAGYDQSPSFPGEWHLYVATTYDGGATWTTVDATPTDPVQRGCIFRGGFTVNGSTCRNLLDFIDASLDGRGRIVVGFADGCTGTCAAGGPITRSALGTIARQSGGDLLYSVPPPIP